MLDWKTKKENKSVYTKKDGGRPYLRTLSAKTRTAQKCIQELKTYRRETYAV